MEINPTTSYSIRPGLTQLPPPPPPSQPLRSSFGSQPAACTPLSQQEGAQELLEKGRGFRSRPTQSQGCSGDGEWSSPSSFSISSSAFSFSDSSGYESQSSLSSSSSSSFLLHFQPASCLSSSSFSTTSSPFPVFQPAPFFSSSVSSSVIPPTPPLSQVPVTPAPKLVPVFKNKHQSHHVNAALLGVQKQKKQLAGGREKPERVSLPSFGKKIPATAPHRSSFTTAAPPILPPPIIPHFSHHPSLHSSTAATRQPSVQPNIKRISSRSPVSNLKPRIFISRKPDKHELQAISKVSSEGNTVTNFRDKMQKEDEKELSAPASSDTSNEETSNFSKKVQKSFVGLPDFVLVARPA